MKMEHEYSPGSPLDLLKRGVITPEDLEEVWWSVFELADSDEDIIGMLNSALYIQMNAKRIGK